MVRSLKLAAAAFLSLVALSPAEARRMPTVEPAALADGALACRGLPDDMAAAERRIVELGWPRQASSGPGDAPMPLFERDGLVLLLYPPDNDGHPMSCVVMAAVPRSAGRPDLAAALSAALGRQPRPDTAGEFPVWVLDGGQVMGMAYTGGGENRVLLHFWYPRTGER